MYESGGGGGGLAGVLAGLPDDAAREAFLAELDACDASPEEVEGWLSGDVPSADALVAADLRAEDLRRGRACPVPPQGLHADLDADDDGLPRLPGGWSDDEVIGWVRRAVALEAHAAWLRSAGLAELASRWSPADTEAFLRSQADPSRRRRMRDRRRTHDRRALRGPDRRGETLRGDRRTLPAGATTKDRVDVEVLAETLVGAEIALACGVSEPTARDWVRAGTDLALDRLPRLGRALCAGRVDWAKARVVAAMLAGRPEHVVVRIDEIVTAEVELPDPVTGAGDPPRIRTVPALKERILSLLLLLDPDGTSGGDDTARERRRVVTRLVDPHTAELVATLPLHQVAEIAAVLDAAVEQARKDDDPRSADQVRADLLVHLLTGHDPAAPEPAAAQDEHPDGQLHDEQPDERQPDDEPADEGQPDEPPGGRPSTCRCGVRPAAQVTLVMSLETLLGLRDDPAYLDRYGPLAADLARDLAANGTFRCAATDPDHGTILGLGRRTYTPNYRPGRRLQDLARTTYRHCSFPGCRAKALRPGQCEIDHADPWPHGPTCSCNTSPLCKRHHQLKTHARLVLEPSRDPADPPGTLHWRLPSGRTYPSRPDPAHTTHDTVYRPLLTDPEEPPPF